MNHKWQNRLLLVASYVFYGAWDWRFLFLICASTVIDYICGIIIHESKDAKKRKLFLLFSVFGNLFILGFFKYFNFFASNLQELLNIFGFSIQPRFLHIILPVGISFYTFQTMSYTIDIYYKKMKPTKKLFDFALFVAFFPQLVAGPIERAKHLLPQILSPRKVTPDKFYEGCYLIFWGLFLKVFVADNLARIVDPIFSSGPPYNGIKVLIALYAFAFQIFGDFAGYSNIARGLAKCMGFDIMVNFNLPYFATNPSEFWKRWHISLSSWLRDYLYIPLGGNRRGISMTYRNLGITMLLGGLWHGAAWTFVVWGAYQGALLIIYRLFQPLLKKIPSPKSIFVGKIWFSIRVIFFFHLICLGWLVFRARSMTQFFEMLQGLLFNFKISYGAGIKRIALNIIFFLLIPITIQLFQYVKKNLLIVRQFSGVTRAIFYVVCYYLLILYGVTSGQEFIYFQF
jgi:alginate O-acetyltransferase complex protein AlgI